MSLDASPALRFVATICAALAVLAAGCTSEPGVQSLTVYSGRSEDLVGPLFDRFTAATGIEIQPRYGETSELAALILEEGDNSPADVFFAQDAGALGAVARAGRLVGLPDSITSTVDSRFRSPDDVWVGVSGRARTIVYNIDNVPESDVPTSVFDLTDDAWRGVVGWAPTNGSFQAFVTAMRRLHGDEVTRTWLSDMLDNDVKEYPKNTPIVDATGRGEIKLGLVNHYYLYQFLADDPAFPAANSFLTDDVGGLINVAGAGILDTTEQPELAEQLVSFLLSAESQRYFAEQTFEYPVVAGVAADPRLPALADLNPPALDLSDLDDLESTVEMLREVGALA